MGYGQTEFAKLIGMSNTNLWKIEHGRVLPTLENLALFARYLEADEAYILFGVPMVSRKKEHERTLTRYAAERRWSSETAALLAALPWELLGVVGTPTVQDAERVLMIIEANQTSGAKGGLRKA
jgi:transcriptional regulator with XRE-family HTH domain